jgi:hypothetical protein
MQIRFKREIAVIMFDHHYDVPECHPSVVTMPKGHVVEVDHVERLGELSEVYDLVYANGDLIHEVATCDFEIIED